MVKSSSSVLRYYTNYRSLLRPLQHIACTTCQQTSLHKRQKLIRAATNQYKRSVGQHGWGLSEWFEQWGYNITLRNMRWHHAILWAPIHASNTRQKITTTKTYYNCNRKRTLIITELQSRCHSDRPSNVTKLVHMSRVPHAMWRKTELMWQTFDIF